VELVVPIYFCFLLEVLFTKLTSTVFGSGVHCQALARHWRRTARPSGTD